MLLEIEKKTTESNSKSQGYKKSIPLDLINKLKNSFGYYINKLENMKKLDRSTILVIISIFFGFMWMLGLYELIIV